MLKTLNEMKIGSEPDESADYWEERAAIDKNIAALTDAKEKLAEIDGGFGDMEAEFKELLTQSKKAADINESQEVCEKL